MVMMKIQQSDPVCPLCISSSKMEIKEVQSAMVADLNVVLGEEVFPGEVTKAAVLFKRLKSYKPEVGPELGPPYSQWTEGSEFLIRIELPTWLITDLDQVGELFAQFVVETETLTISQAWKGKDGK